MSSLSTQEMKCSVKDIYACSIQGVEGEQIEVEVEVSFGVQNEIQAIWESTQQRRLLRSWMMMRLIQTIDMMVPCSVASSPRPTHENLQPPVERGQPLAWCGYGI